MRMDIQLMDWESARVEASPIRFAVFVAEQGVPAEIELDEHDAHCIHAIARDAQGHAVGTARLLPAEPAPGGPIGHIGRMAVLASHRGQGVGAALLGALIAAARERGDIAVALSAQTHALEFYRRFSFMEEGPQYMEAGIPHQAMRLVLRA